MAEHRLDFASPPDDVTAVHEFLARVWGTEPSVGPEDRMAFELALVELASNVVEHAGADARVACSLALAVRDGGLEAGLTDDGLPASVDPSGRRAPRRVRRERSRSRPGRHGRRRAALRA